jgi:dTDP-4-dehydrorhamnose 3,5-epimerase-like enzyme
MLLRDKVQLISREYHADGRGWLVKVITGAEEHMDPRLGEVYVTSANPGQVRGNHYHTRTSEWFTVIQGTVMAVIVDPATGERLGWTPRESEHVTMSVPPGIAHAFKNPETSTNAAVLIAYADQRYEPLDTVNFIVIP